MPEPGSDPLQNSPAARMAESGPSALIAVVFGAVLATSFVTSVSAGVWVGLAGVFCCTRLQSHWRAARTWALFGLAFFGISFSWMSVVTWPGYMALVLYHVLHVALFGLVLSFVTAGRRLPLTSTAPPLWVVSELMRSRLLGGLPWMLLAHPLGEKTVFVQIAQWTGAAGVSFMVVMVSAAVAELGLKLPALAVRLQTGGDRHRWKDGSPWVSAGLAMLVVLGSCIYGTLRVVGARLEEGPTVALVQGAVPTPMKSLGSPEESREVDRRLWEAYSSLTEELASGLPADRELDLVVWPESALPGVFGSGTALEERMRELSRRSGVPMLVGTNSRRDGRQTNTAVLLISGELAGSYDKEHLVPFGEYIPLGRLGRALFPFDPLTQDYAAGGREQAPIRVGRWDMAANICFEDIFGPLGREHVRRGAQILVNLTNDSWFDSTAEPYQHSLAARFRAIELGVSLLRATNTGITCIYDPYGRAVAGPEPLKRGHLVATVVLRCCAPQGDTPPATGYLRHGDLFAWCCLGSSVLLLLLAFRRRWYGAA